MNIEYQSLFLNADLTLYGCGECGALVRNTARHDKWHRGLAGHSHHTLSVIGSTSPALGGQSMLRSGGQTYDTGPRPSITTPRPDLT